MRYKIIQTLLIHILFNIPDYSLTINVDSILIIDVNSLLVETEYFCTILLWKLKFTIWKNIQKRELIEKKL